MLTIAHIAELATGRAREVGTEIIRDAAVVVDGEKIVANGKTSQLLKRFPKRKGDKEIDATGKIVIPGFVDCHTHLVFAGSRAEEYRDKIRGVSYAALHKKGRGIHSTVAATRRASEEELFASAKKTLDEMLRLGTTTVEIKSGYGLTLGDELKILSVIRRLKKTAKQDIVATFLGAHTVPREYKGKRGAYVDLVVDTMLPRVAKEGLAEYVDVFCDPLGFTAKETGKIFARARALGLPVRVHGEQTAHGGGAAAGAKFHAASVDHCDHLRDGDIALMKRSGTTAVILPGVLLHTMEWQNTALPAVVKKLRAARVPIALATDYNPGSSPLLSMKLVMDLGMRFFRMEGGECLAGATGHPAVALGLGKRVGSIEAGKQADLLVIDAPSVAEYLYRIGESPIALVVKKGAVVIKN
ncbi:MAG: imidazolonepropionase [Candidatus Lloydbacteria bacterium RIFCSPHIGHO2_02_FULL_54_17]|uniref:Imidazolonepropionase n=1 Tax=Candidatus Lloydbacteria bacterium RIFCSPHIGHO2_02_FULL_54_17 TaxID=1798664 RepID=A0A1G2DEC0_9BACT|nr:MAG: imidazolonepropionase [Candidatus Lloydbacteria bacterium RIFCSPHIGHO2_01_FULL_54_11]OGZ11792.1 MAG: imidazolonepropionase [Candidatus Lloydbacteria bacterium RIFCSPHIGHO2_02_FULL_54_17]OGZ14321.1 MAG: imidazolonepropionase [Candidatus Lloydbacteria bacterium RIFCSPLOWO2_01_FULL_54_18]OGZ16011.1 MAG: imidazolonepropionase [Candidatus Lloydbacteria bacterium RIFCSPLOWO2_02_FULL_54_12]